MTEAAALNASRLLISSLRLSAVEETDLHKRWIALSHRLGARLPRSMLPVSIQRAGEIDLLVRSFERVAARDTVLDADTDFFRTHYQCMFSELWILAIYEVSRTLRARKLALAGTEAAAVHRDLELVRMVVAKHEIASDKSLAEPMALVRERPMLGDEPYLYDRRDPLRAHIAPVVPSESGSIGWWVIDGKTGQTSWVERLSLSERLIVAWEAEPSPAN